MIGAHPRARTALRRTPGRTHKWGERPRHAGPTSLTRWGLGPSPRSHELCRRGGSPGGPSRAGPTRFGAD
eukprot:3437166-Prymnesium_polylepis.2